QRTAPHLARPLPQLLPEYGLGARQHRKLVGVGEVAELLRAAARTSRDTLPKPCILGRVETARLVPALRGGFDRGLVHWDGQLVDDARLVVTVARTAAAYGASVLTRCRALTVSGDGAEAYDELTGTRLDLRARAVVNATGVWAGSLSPDVTLRPSRGTHLLLRSATLGGFGTALTVPFPDDPSRFLLVLPWGEGLVLVGLTDVAADGELPDVPQGSDAEVDYLLGALGEVLQVPVSRADVVGTFAGLRPLLADPGRAAASTADLSRRHAVTVGADGLVTVTGGKLTTYRRMAEDAVDTAARTRGLAARRCRTSWLPLVGAASPSALDAVQAPRRLVDRYGTEAPRVVSMAGGDPALLRPVADGLHVTGAELLFGLRHEGALDESDLLDRRTRLGLVPADRERALPAVRTLLAAASERSNA
ncbi:MAG: glycerol-3-phosphate dehydrogenase/oxidase, partial [Streptosporangiales bacterium]